MNKLIIDQFAQLLKQNKAEYLNARMENDLQEVKMQGFRLKSNKKVLDILKKLNFEITDANDLKNIPGVGKSTMKRIDEILTTGKLDELKNKYDKKKQSKIDSIQELEKVIGIGSANAKTLVTKYKIYTIDELKRAIAQGKYNATNTIKLGLKYYGIVEGNIPRSEIALIEKYLKKIASSIAPDLEIMICGSYRRCKPTSGDIDVLLYNSKVMTAEQLSHPKEYNLDYYLDRYVDELTRDKFLLDNMTDKNYHIKYMGFCKYKNHPVRRIDIRYVPFESLPSAMLYYTGPYELNAIMRSAAKKRGMLLNEYGLYKLLTDDRKGSKRKISVKSEADIFKKLGMKYLTPDERESYSTGKIKKTL